MGKTPKVSVCALLTCCVITSYLFDADRDFGYMGAARDASKRAKRNLGRLLSGLWK